MTLKIFNLASQVDALKRQNETLRANHTDRVLECHELTQELKAARAEVEHWIERYNQLEQWRAQTSQLHLRAEAELARLRRKP